MVFGIKSEWQKQQENLDRLKESYFIEDNIDLFYENERSIREGSELYKSLEHGGYIPISLSEVRQLFRKKAGLIAKDDIKNIIKSRFVKHLIQAEQEELQKNSSHRYAPPYSMDLQGLEKEGFGSLLKYAERHSDIKREIQGAIIKEVEKGCAEWKANHREQQKLAEKNLEEAKVIGLLKECVVRSKHRDNDVLLVRNTLDTLKFRQLTPVNEEYLKKELQRTREKYYAELEEKEEQKQEKLLAAQKHNIELVKEFGFVAQVVAEHAIAGLLTVYKEVKARTQIEGFIPINEDELRAYVKEEMQRFEKMNEEKRRQLREEQRQRSYAEQSLESEKQNRKDNNLSRIRDMNLAFHFVVRHKGQAPPDHLNKFINDLDMRGLTPVDINDLEILLAEAAQQYPLYEQQCDQEAIKFFQGTSPHQDEIQRYLGENGFDVTTKNVVGFFLEKMLNTDRY